jgi:hypothetical protein
MILKSKTFAWICIIVNLYVILRPSASIMDTDVLEKENKTISIFRVKGFFPNLSIEAIKSIIQLGPLLIFLTKLKIHFNLIRDTYGSINYVVNLHGFRDSCLSLYSDTVRVNQISRNGVENFVSIYYENSIDRLYFFHDFNKSFVNKK